MASLVSLVCLCRCTAAVLTCLVEWRATHRWEPMTPSVPLTRRRHSIECRSAQAGDRRACSVGPRPVRIHTELQCAWTAASQPLSQCEMLVHFSPLSAHRFDLPSLLRLYNRLRPSSVCSTTNLSIRTISKSITMPSYKSVPGADQFYPLNEPAIGTAYPEVRSGRLAMANASLTSTAIPECLPAECSATHSLPTSDDQRCNLQEQDLRRKHSVSRLDSRSRN